MTPPTAIEEARAILASGPTMPPAASEPISGPVTRSFDQIEETAIEWLWPGVFPLGKLSVVQGDPGLGKSFLTIDLAARVSSGLSFPGELATPGKIRKPGGVVLISSEDDAADTIKPRLRVAGADCSRVHELTGRRGVDGKVFPFVLDAEGLAALEGAARSIDNCRLVVIDPVAAYMGKVDSNNNAEVRSVLGPLADMAARCRLAVVMVTHMNKSGSGNSVYRGIGSIAFNAAARATWTVIRADHEKNHDYTESTRLFLCSKLNIAKDHNGRSYDLVSTSDGGVRLAWSEEALNMRADDAMNDSAPAPGPRPEKIEGCMELIADELAGGPLSSATVQDRCRAAGYSSKVIREARDRLGVLAEQRGRQWVSMLPPKPDAQGELTPAAIDHDHGMPV